MVLELFFIIPYLSGKAMENQQKKKQQEEAYAEALKRYQARIEKMMRQGKTQEEAEAFLAEERERRTQRYYKLVEDGMTQEEALTVLAEEKRQQEEQERLEEEANEPPKTPELDEQQEEEESTDEEEVEKELYAMMVGRRVNEEGQVVDKKTGIVLGEVVEGKLKRLIGKKVRENGEIFNSKGKLVGRAEPIMYYSQEEEEDESEEDDEEKEETEEKEDQLEPEQDTEEAIQDLEVGKANTDLPKIKKSGKVIDANNHVVGFVEKHMAAKFEGFTVDPNGHVLDHNQQIVGQAQMIGTIDDNSPQVRKSGKVLDMNDNVVGQVEKQLAVKWAGFKVSENGLVVDTEGNVVGKAIMLSNTSAPTVRKSGKVVDEEDNIVGYVDKSLARECVGFIVDPRGNIIHPDGRIVGRANLIALEHERSIELSDHISTMTKPSLAKVKPLLDSINECVDKEEAKPKKERNEEALVNSVKPLFDQATARLKEILGMMGKLDANIYSSVCAQEFKGEASSEQYNLANRIANSIKDKAFEREASPEECNLADLLACLAVDVVSTMNNAKKKIKSMPFAKKELTPSLSDLKSVLLQMTAFIGLLLPTVLWIAGNLLQNRDHGSVIRLLLGGLGLKKLLMKFGLADALKLS